MLYNIISDSREVKMGVSSEEIEVVLRSLQPGATEFSLVSEMEEITAVLVRSPSTQDIIRLAFRGRQVELLRKSKRISGDIGVSCSPDGDRVPVETINIEFREYNDKYTNRGLVWVRPETFSSMFFVIRASALATTGLVTEIVEQAEVAVKKQLLDRFAG